MTSLRVCDTWKQEAVLLGDIIFPPFCLCVSEHLCAQLPAWEPAHVLFRSTSTDGEMSRRVCADETQPYVEHGRSFPPQNYDFNAACHSFVIRSERYLSSAGLQRGSTCTGLKESCIKRGVFIPFKVGTSIWQVRFTPLSLRVCRLGDDTQDFRAIVQYKSNNSRSLALN